MPLPPTADPGLLGGRLALLDPADLNEEQRGVYDALTAMVVPEGAAHGFVPRLDDGRFIGPFNAMLRAPAITAGLGGFTAAIARSGMTAQVRQVVILTVGSIWGAEYEIQAHVSAARAVGVPATAIDDIVSGRAPRGLTEQATVAHRLAHAVVADRRVDDELYEQAIAEFGEPGLVAVLALIGQYQYISSLLSTFRVPAPGRHDGHPDAQGP